MKLAGAVVDTPTFCWVVDAPTFRAIVETATLIIRTPRCASHVRTSFERGCKLWGVKICFAVND
jgi:hypothetical protein